MQHDQLKRTAVRVGLVLLVGFLLVLFYGAGAESGYRDGYADASDFEAGLERGKDCALYALRGRGNDLGVYPRRFEQCISDFRTGSGLFDRYGELRDEAIRSNPERFPQDP